MAETVVLIGELPDDGREVDVLHRNARHEHFDLQFVGGLLVLRDPKSEQEAKMDRDPLWHWIDRRKAFWFTCTDAVRAMNDADAGIGKSAAYNRLKQWTAEQKLETKFDETNGKEYSRRRQAARLL